MKLKAFLCVFLVLMALVLVGCKDTPDGPPDTPDAPAYNDPTHTTGEFKVVFKMGTETVTHRYDKGEMPDPPEVESYENGDFFMEFDGWKTELVPVTENTTYEAAYKKTLMEYKATFIYGRNGERSVTRTQDRGVAPEPPRVVDELDYKFVGWDREIVASTTDVTYRAIYTNLLSPDQLKNAYNAPLFQYQCHNSNDAIQACNLFILAYHEHEDPQDGVIRDRLVEQLDSLCGKGNAPDFDAWPNFSYPIITSTVAIVRDTPTVWDILTPTQKAKLDTLMEAFAYLCSVATSDYNSYNTGPGLRGNYYKTWNPNYRFANVTNIVFSVYYFGAGDMKAGADTVNEKLKSFNEERYDAMINRFLSYGWNYAYDCWTKDGIKAANGQVSTSTAKQLLVNGGTITHTTNDGSALKESGASSLGVSNGGNDYIYSGYLQEQKLYTGAYTLYECEKIIEDMMYFNYAGGAVKSEHWADGDNDGAEEKVAWIVDGSLSPYQGQMGMMTEFASGVRSSTSYCREDFIMIVPILTASSILPRYTTEGRKTEVELDAFGNVKPLDDYTRNAELWKLIQVGNEDFLYKFRAGYQSYAHGSYGVASSVHSEADHGDTGYFLMREVWRTAMKPKGDVPIFEDMISQ